MKRFLLSAFVVLTFTIYALKDRLKMFSFDDLESERLSDEHLTSPGIGLNDKPVNPTATPKSSSMMGMNGSMPSMKLKDGKYDGDVTDAYYGLVQVRLTVEGGRITGVDFLKYPNDRSTSIYINSQAMPYLKSEALNAQSAKVDIITGATATSEAFRESLASALVQAKP